MWFSPIGYRVFGLLYLISVVCGCTQATDGTESTEVVSATRSISKSLEAGDAASVVVELFRGEIRVGPSKSGKVQIKLTAQGSGATKEEAEASLKNVVLDVNETDGEVHVSATRKSGEFGLEEAKLDLQVPAGCNLVLKTTQAAISVARIEGSILAATTNAPIEIKGGAGAVQCSTTYGAIQVLGGHSQVVAKTTHSPITIKDAKGKVDAKTDSGEIEVDAPSPEIIAQTSLGDILVRRATGTLRLTSASAGIDVDAPCTDVTATTSNGHIFVKGATGALDLRTSKDQILVEAHATNVKAITENGAIHIKGASGTIEARTHAEEIVIEANHAQVTAINRDANVQFRGTLVDGEHTFKTVMGNIKVELPPETEFEIDAITTFGDIDVRFPLKKQPDSTGDHVMGSVGENPRILLEMENSNANIHVIKPGDAVRDFDDDE